MSKLLQERWMRLAFAPNSTTVRINEADEAHKNSKIYDDCWDGYVKVAGKERGEDGSCEKRNEADETLSEDKDRPGMWYYINKNKAEGKPPKKPGDPGYPSEEAWEENTKKAGSDPLDEADEMFSGLEEGESYTITMTEADEADENLAFAIAEKIIDEPDAEEVTIDGKEFPVEMSKEKAEEITGKTIEEAISNWYKLINEDGFDKEKKDKMKCNSDRYLRDGEPGHGEKQKVVKACDPDSDAEKIIKFGDANMKNKKNVDSNRENFRSRFNCSDKNLSDDWDTASYWACRDW